MGNQIPLMFDGSVTTKPLVPSGKVKLLAVAYKSRLPDFPNVPTMAEVGYPELDFSNWAGVFASGKTPQPLLEKINATLQKVNASQAVRARYLSTGFEPIKQERTLEQLSTDLQAEYQRNGEIVRNFGIKLN